MAVINIKGPFTVIRGVVKEQADRANTRPLDVISARLPLREIIFVEFRTPEGTTKHT